MDYIYIDDIIVHTVVYANLHRNIKIEKCIVYIDDIIVHSGVYANYYPINARFFEKPLLLIISGSSSGCKLSLIKP